MVGEFGEVIVMDWGVAKLLERPAGTAGSDVASRERPGDGAREERAPLPHVAGGAPLTSDGDVIGTRGYMAPEQERGDTAATSPRSDVWALGAILRELATAACAPAGAGLPRPLAAIVARATAALPARPLRLGRGAGRRRRPLRRRRRGERLPGGPVGEGEPLAAPEQDGRGCRGRLPRDADGHLRLARAVEEASPRSKESAATVNRTMEPGIGPGNERESS